MSRTEDLSRSSGMRNLRLITAAATGLLICVPATLPGQVRINGQVVDNATLSPIEGADVRITTRDGRRLGRLMTDERGRFTFTVQKDGGYIFTASRLGYKGNETPILWTDGFRDYQVEIRLDAEAVLLAPIEVLARSRYSSPVLDGFRARQRTGMGHYFTDEDIERIKPGRVTDLLQRVPGVHLKSGGAGLQRIVTMGRGGECPAEVFVDGVQWTLDMPGTAPGGPGFSVDDAVAPGSVLGIEVYRGLSTVPAEFLTPRARCGVVAIWTRRGGPASEG